MKAEAIERGCQGQGRSPRGHGRAGCRRQGGSRNRADRPTRPPSRIATPSWRSSMRLEDSVKVAQAQLNVAQSLVTANRGAGQAVRGGPAVGPDRPRSHEDHRAGGRRRRLAKRGRRTDGCRQPGCADVVPDCPGPDEDAGGHQRLRSGRRTRARESAGHLHRRRLSRDRCSRAL